ncbi:MAG: flagellar basal body P-ring formation chaperone FlgA [Sulfuricurvum sp.]
MILLLAWLLLSVSLSAITIEPNYTSSSKDLTLDLVTKNPQDAQVLLGHIERLRYKAMIRQSEIAKLLLEHGYSEIQTTTPYSTFTLTSSADLSSIKEELLNYFRSSYNHIAIHSLDLTPRAYLTTLPDEFEIIIEPRSFRYANSTIHIVTNDRKKIFFDYTIDADVMLLEVVQHIKSGTKLDSSNIKQKSIKLSRLKSVPIQDLSSEQLEASRPLRVGEILTDRDVKALKLIHRGDEVSISYTRDGILLQSSAKSLQDGKLNDIITLTNSNNKVLKARVVGEKRAVIE